MQARRPCSFSFVRSVLPLLCLSAAACEEEPTRLSDVRNDLGIQLRVNEAPQGGVSTFDLSLILPEEDPSGGCDEFDLEATINGVRMTSFYPGGEGGAVHEESYCDAPSFELPVSAVPDLSKIEVVIWDDSHRVRARYEPVRKEPRIEWVAPRDGVVCVGGQGSVRLTPAPQPLVPFDGNSHAPSYELPDAVYRPDGVATSEPLFSLKEQDGVLSFVLSEDAEPGVVSLTVSSDFWFKGEEVTLCEGAVDCGTIDDIEGFERNTVASLPMRIEACDRVSK